MTKAASTEGQAHETLLAALVAAQADFKGVEKTKTGARPNQKYAPLDEVLGMARPILNKHGLFLSQPTYVEGGDVFVRTLITHAGSGACIESTYPVGPSNLQHQQLGGGLSYARRYALLSIISIHPEDEDDDGEKAGPAGGERAPPPPPKPQPPRIRPAAQPFIDKAVEELTEAKGSDDAICAAYDAIKAKPGWAQLTPVEKAAVDKIKGELLGDGFT